MTTKQMSFTDAPKPPVIDDERRGLYLAFCKADKKQPASEVVTDGIERYRDKFGVEPTVVMTSHADAVDLEGFTALQVAPRTFISAGNFYIGRDAA